MPPVHDHVGLAGQLAEAEERFTLAFEAAPIGKALVAPDGRWLRANPALCRILGYAEAELQSLTFQDVTHPDDLESDLDLVHQVIAGVIPRYAIEKRYVRRDGQVVHAQLDVALVRDEWGHPRYFISQVQDISARTAAVAALAHAEETQRASLDALEQGVVLATATGEVQVSNRAAERILGIPREEMAERFLSPDWATFAEDGHRLGDDERPVLHTFRTGRPVHEQVVGSRRPDGEVRQLRVSTQPVRDGEGAVTGVVVAFADITEQREAERARAEAERALRATNTWYAALVERSSDIICVLDGDGLVRYVSPAGAALWGGTLDHGHGRSFAAVVHPEDREAVLAAFADLVDRPGQARTAACRIRTSRSTYRHVEIVATNRLDDPDVAGIVANVRDVTERAEAAARLAWQAYHDPLTGLPNRALLNDRLGPAVERSRRRGERLALLFVDVDRFKGVNDTLGHEAGDQLLVELAERITRAVRAGDTVARLGGDEFVVVTETATDPAAVTQVARRIGAAVARPVPLDQGEVRVSSSIGIAFDHGGDPGALLRDADIALYRAKQQGRDRYEIFDDSLRVAALRRLSVEQELRDALTGDTLDVHFQPVVDLEAGTVLAAEALLRLPDGAGGLRAPAEHVAVADDSGLIIPIGALVLDRACAALARWRAELGPRAPARVAVNIAGRQIGSPDLAGSVARATAAHGLAPEDLVLELTESTVIDADRSTLRTVEQLHEMGVHLAIDDFGTGYSSLAYLKRFPIRIVKVDRTFVAGLGLDRSDTEIVRAVVSLGDALGLDVVAEGIETPAQLEALRELGCRRGQGYLLARPAPAGQLPDQRARVAAALGTPPGDAGGASR